MYGLVFSNATVEGGYYNIGGYIDGGIDNGYGATFSPSQFDKWISFFRVIIAAWCFVKMKRRRRLLGWNYVLSVQILNAVKCVAGGAEVSIRFYFLAGSVDPQPAHNDARLMAGHRYAAHRERGYER